MRDGLYRVQIETQLAVGCGVVLLEGGKLRGGDSQFNYVGTYAEAGQQFTARVQADRCIRIPGDRSAFGVDCAHIALVGITKGDAAEMNGTATERPGISFRATLTRISD